MRRSRTPTQAGNWSVILDEQARMPHTTTAHESRGGDDAARPGLSTPRRSTTGRRSRSSNAGDAVGGWPSSNLEWLSADSAADTGYDDVDRRLMDTFPASDAVARY
jgi:hypothetical protein